MVGMGLSMKEEMNDVEKLKLNALNAKNLMI